MTHRSPDALSHIRNLIWDWNGTLLDDVDLCVEIISELHTVHHKKTVTIEDYRAHFGFPVIHFYQHLGFDISQESFERLSEVFIGTYYDRFQSRPPREHAEAIHFARFWKACGHRQAILSASRQDHLESAVARLKLGGLFEKLAGLRDIYAGGKIELGRELLEQLAWDPAYTLLIGDTDHDAEVAAKMGVECLLVARGHQHIERLKKTPALIVSSLGEAAQRYGLGNQGASNERLPSSA